MSVASDEGTSGWRGQQLEGDHLLKGVVCVQKAGYPPPGMVGAERRYWKNKVMSNPSPITEAPGFRKRAGNSARNDHGGGRGRQTKVTAPPPLGGKTARAWWVGPIRDGDRSARTGAEAVGLQVFLLLGGGHRVSVTSAVDQVRSAVYRGRPAASLINR